MVYITQFHLDSLHKVSVHNLGLFDQLYTGKHYKAR